MLGAILAILMSVPILIAQVPHQIMVFGLASDGIMVQEVPEPTPVPEPTIAPEPTPEPTVIAAETPDTIPSIICYSEFAWNCDQALSIAWCESRYNPEAVNPYSGALGLFQMMPGYHWFRFQGGYWGDPWVNTIAAYSLWLEEGWEPWSCSPYGWHP